MYMNMNIVQLVATLKKLSSTKFTFVINCVFIWYKVKNISQAQKRCVLHTLQHKLFCKCPPRHQYQCLYI